MLTPRHPLEATNLREMQLALLKSLSVQQMAG